MKENRIHRFLRIVIIFMAIVFTGEFAARMYFTRLLTRYQNPFVKSSIPGVPYIQNDFPRVVGAGENPRIVIIGDYLSRHRGTHDKNNYPEILAQKLGGRYTVINTSAMFYSLPEERGMLEYAVKAYKPATIVWGYVFNDLFLYYKQFPLALIALSERPRIYDILSLKAVRTYLNRLVVKNPRFFLNKITVPWLLKRIAQAHDDSRLRGMLRETLRTLKHLEKEQGIKSVFVIIPVFSDFNDPWFIKAHARVLTECQQEGVSYIDMLTVFESLGMPAVKENDGDVWHQNALGNELIADSIYQVIQSDGSQ